MTLGTTMRYKKMSSLFLNNSVKNEPIVIIFGMYATTEET